MDPGPRLQVCKWTGCGENFPTSKELHDHVRDSHVANEVAVAGSFTCGWGSCPTTTKRRGKLVSHLLVHVNYKAHKCNMCEKTYKRPHELKKHQEKWHDQDLQQRTPRALAEGGLLAPTIDKDCVEEPPVIDGVLALEALGEIHPEYQQCNEEPPVIDGMFALEAPSESHPEYQQYKEDPPAEGKLLTDHGSQRLSDGKRRKVRPPESRGLLAPSVCNQSVPDNNVQRLPYDNMHCMLDEAMQFQQGEVKFMPTTTYGKQFAPGPTFENMMLVEEDYAWPPAYDGMPAEYPLYQGLPDGQQYMQPSTGNVYFVPDALFNCLPYSAQCAQLPAENIQCPPAAPMRGMPDAGVQYNMPQLAYGVENGFPDNAPRMSNGAYYYSHPSQTGYGVAPGAGQISAAHTGSAIHVQATQQQQPQDRRMAHKRLFDLAEEPH